MQVPVYSLAGEVIKNIEISDEVFAVSFNQAVVHQAMRIGNNVLITIFMFH